MLTAFMPLKTSANKSNKLIVGFTYENSFFNSKLILSPNLIIAFFKVVFPLKKHFERQFSLKTNIIKGLIIFKDLILGFLVIILMKR